MSNAPILRKRIGPKGRLIIDGYEYHGPFPQPYLPGPVIVQDWPSGLMRVYSHTGTVGSLALSIDEPGDYLEDPHKRVYYYPDGPVLNGWQVNLINLETSPTLVTVAVPGVSNAPVYTRNSLDQTLLQFIVDAQTGALTFAEVTF